MIYINNETDEAVRNWLNLNDLEFESYINNRVLGLEKIKQRYLERKNSSSYKESIKTLEKEAKEQKNKRNLKEVLQFNIVLNYMDDEIEPKEIEEIATLAGTTRQNIQQQHASAINKLRCNRKNMDGGILYDYFTPEQTWQN